jgi:ATP-dependent DNA ligase
MLARPARSLPDRGHLYEPRWDGFRVLATTGRDAALWSRDGHPLARYFPEMTGALSALGPALLDGALVAAGPGGLEYGAVASRLHRAPGRVLQLRCERPAAYAAFDLLAADGEDLRGLPFAERRARLEALLRAAPAPLLLTPVTRDLELARRWLAPAGGPPGIDGVVAKAEGLAYLGGERAAVEVRARAAGVCAVTAYRRAGAEARVDALRLALAGPGGLAPCGEAGGFGEPASRELFRSLAGASPPPPRATVHPSVPPPEDTPADAEGWTLVARPLACEVAFDGFDGTTFTGRARFLRWRPDREPSRCEPVALLRRVGVEPRSDRPAGDLSPARRAV